MLEGRDELGILPFLPGPESAEASPQEGVTQYPFIVQEQGTKLGIPIFCWVPLVDISYEILKHALRPVLPGTTTETRTETKAQDWWRDQGTAFGLVVRDARPDDTISFEL